jgi:transposase
MSRMTPEQSAQIVALYHQGLSYRDITKKVGAWGHDVVTWHLKKHGITPDRSRGFRGGKKANIIAMARDGMPNLRIAETLGISKLYVQYVISNERCNGAIIPYDRQRQSAAQ